MIEIAVKEFLKQRLPVPVLMEFPPNPPDCFVVLRKADSSRENLVDTTMFLADSYAESQLEASKLNELVKDALDALTELDTVSSSRRGGDYSFTDTKNMRYRYQAVQSVTHY